MTKTKYLKLHYWIRKNLGVAKYCSNDKTHIAKVYDWANISGEYKKDLSDYRPLCRSCHCKEHFTEKKRRKFIGNKFHCRSIDVFDKSNEFIKTYPSIKEASLETNTIRTGIVNCLSRKTKTSGGFVWQYH